jgi:hypothetical protein
MNSLVDISMKLQKNQQLSVFVKTTEAIVSD